MPIDGFTIRRVLLEVCVEYERQGPGYFQSNPVLREVANRLQIRALADSQALLTSFGDLFRQGVLAWGYDLANTEPPFMHVTEVGRRSLANLSRDPYNPDGYLATVRPRLTNYPIALAYVEEALRTFQADCLKATAVMIGGAAEALVIATREVLVTRLAELNAQIPPRLNDWKVKTVRDAISNLLDGKKAQMERRLYERFSAFWVAVSDQMRLARNDAGHPVSIEPVTHETVHAALLLFPEFAALVSDLDTWIKTELV